MTNKIEINLIEIVWSGPHQIKLEEFKSFESNDGLYQIYGTHPIYGRNVLLYIGITLNKVDERIWNHFNNWIKYEFDDVIVYKGEVKSKEIIDDEKLKGKYIGIAEKLLIYYCAPSYNTNEKTDIAKVESSIVMNFGKIGSLPTEVSTLWYHSKAWDHI